MSRPKQMTRCVITGHKSRLEPTIDVLHELNLFHVEDFVEGDDPDFKIGTPIGNSDDVSRKLVKIRSISNYLHIGNGPGTQMKSSEVSSEIDTELEKLDEEITGKTEAINNLENRLKEIEAAEKELMPFLAADRDLDDYRGFDSLAVFVGTVSGKLDESVIAGITSGSYMLETNSEFMSLFVSKKYEEAVAATLNALGFKETRIPEKSGKPSALIAELNAEKSGILAQLETLKADIQSLKESYSDFIRASDEYLSILSEKAELPLRIATSEYAFIMNGWVPTESFDAMVKAIEARTDGRVYISSEEVNLHDEKEVLQIPVAHNNSKPARSLEWIIDLYSRPKYTEIDPSSVLMISFPLIYGMILGDIGYALVLLTLGLLAKKFIKIDGIDGLLNVLIYCQVSALFFGILYGEFMGFPLAGATSHGVYTPGLIPGFETIVTNISLVNGISFLGAHEYLTFPIHRTHLIYTMLVATALFGLLHMNVGFILGFINVKNQHGMMHAICGKASWIMLELGVIILIVGFVLGKNIALIGLGALIALVAVALLFKGEGIAGPIEIPGLFGNILSYTRIIAVGLSSIYIASTVNTIAFEMLWSPSNGFSPMIIVALIVFVLGHLLNTGLSIIAPGLHALRLQYVEFFGKYYTGGGKEYKPFGHIRKYLEE